MRRPARAKIGRNKRQYRRERPKKKSGVGRIRYGERNKKPGGKKLDSITSHACEFEEGRVDSSHRPFFDYAIKKISA